MVQDAGPPALRTPPASGGGSYNLPLHTAETEHTMCNNFCDNSCLWIIIVLILLFCCRGGGMCGCTDGCGGC